MKTSDKRADVMQAALELIAEQGFHGAPMARVAERAGVAAGTIYRYFESKDVLINELYREVEKKIMETIQEGHPADATIRERFLQLSTALLRFMIANPIQFRYLEQYHNSPYGANLRRSKILKQSDDHNVFVKLFEQGIAGRVLKDLPLFMHFALAFGPQIALARDHILGLTLLDDDLIGKAVEACWDSIKK
jgi:TetR/AcrR family transcriptional regulator, repressor of fatR-cypB operon